MILKTIKAPRILLKMAPRKILRLAGSKLAAVREDQVQPKTEPNQGEAKKEEPEETEPLAGVMEGLNLGATTRFEAVANSDDEVFIPHDEFTEQDPNAKIVDVSGSGSSPPRGSPVQQFEQFTSVMRAAQVEVNNQAKDAIGSIARNLREVEGRSLRCLERELAIQRRESALREREAVVTEREEQLRVRRSEVREMPVSWNNWGKGRGKIAKKTRWGPARPATPQPTSPMEVSPVRQVLMPLKNKRGETSYMFVDDISRPVGGDDFIREVVPSSIPWLHRRKFNMEELRESRQFGLNQISRPKPFDKQGMRFDYTRVPYNYNDGKDDAGSRKRRNSDDDGRNPPKGKGAGGSKRRGKRSKSNANHYKGAPSCNHEKIGERRRRDDDEDPPETSRSFRPRCHSNVVIRQNVNVK